MTNPKRFVDPSDVSAAIRDASTARNGITARAGGGQANATLLTAAINRVTTVATAGDSVKLPRAVPGARFTVINRSASSMNVFPSAGGVINALSADAAYAVAAAKTVEFVCALAGTWDTNLTA